MVFQRSHSSCFSFRIMIGCPILCDSRPRAVCADACSVAKGGRQLLSNFDGSFFAIPVMPNAAPGPELRRCYQSTLHRIEMDIVQLLNLLVLCSDVEVMRPRQPE